MEIVSIVSILGLVGVIVYMQHLHSKAIIQIRTIEKAKDVREIKEYVLPIKGDSKAAAAETPLKDLEDIGNDDLDKIISSATNGR